MTWPYMQPGHQNIILGTQQPPMSTWKGHSTLVKSCMSGHTNTHQITRRTGFIYFPCIFCLDFYIRRSIAHIFVTQFHRISWCQLWARSCERCTRCLRHGTRVFSGRQEPCGGDTIIILSFCRLKHISTTVSSIKFPSNLWHKQDLLYTFCGSVD